MARLLILACSQRKRPEPMLLPALNRYDGPMFRVVRRYLLMDPLDPPDLYILSARFGLIGPDDPIPLYDQWMTPERARELAPILVERLHAILDVRPYSQVLLSLGRSYLPALARCRSILEQRATVWLSEGSPGRRVAELYDWLYGRPPERFALPRIEVTPGTATLRGRQVTMTPAEVLAVARRGLAEEPAAASRYQSWYVLVGSDYVSPKWLVRRLTGLPVSHFATDEARRMLARLGIEAKRG